MVRGRPRRYGRAAAAAVVALVAGYLALASALGWPPLRGSEVQLSPALPASPDAESASGQSEPQFPESSAVQSAAVGNMGLPLEASDCTTYPEGTPLGQMRFAYIQGSPWQTDFNTRCVPMLDFFYGGPGKDGIPALVDPAVETVDEADAWLHDDEPVLVVTSDGTARAYPLAVLLWHEIVNDSLGDLDLVVTYCPLCNTALAFDRLLDGRARQFRTTGLLRWSDLVMYDVLTESWWQQLTGQALVGAFSGTVLTPVPAFHATWREFREAYPQGQVLSRDTGYERPYGQTPYVYYDRARGPDPALWTYELDPRLRPMERVTTVSLDGSHVAFPFSILAANPIVHYELSGQPLVVFHNSRALSVLDTESIASARAVGVSSVFLTTVQGRKLTFRIEGGWIVDGSTGSQWNRFGEALWGPMEGTQLTPVISTDSLWFSWARFRPDTLLYEGG